MLDTKDNENLTMRLLFKGEFKIPHSVHIFSYQSKQESDMKYPQLLDHSVMQDLSQSYI